MNHQTRSRAAAVLVFATVAGATLACDRASEQLLEPPTYAPLATPQCLDRGAPDYYFAPGQINESDDDAFMRRRWFLGYLATAGTESLSCGDPKEAYRLLWLPASRHAKIFTIRPGAEAWQLEIIDFGKEPFSALDSNTSHEVARSTRDITPSDVRRIQLELELIGFWAAKQYQSHPEVMDGYALLIEGRSGNKYRAITRVNLWDGTEQVACPLFHIARIMLPDPIRCVRPVTVP